LPVTNSPNHFLSSLSAHDRDLLQPHLRSRQLPLGTALYRADDIIPNVYFPCTGIMSMVVGVSSGQFVEAGMLGRNSVVGTGAALDGPNALNTAIAQVASTGMEIAAGVLKELAGKSKPCAWRWSIMSVRFPPKLSRWLRAMHCMNWRNV
jgi:CRP-like cAMP-binding protein